MTLEPRPKTNAGKSNAIVASFVLLFLASCLWFAREPGRQFYDEIWYAGQCANDSWEQVLVQRDHPPLGFAILCSGIRVFGDGPIGWRIGSAVMGAASVAALLSLLVQLRVRASWILVAGVFFVTDPLLLVLSRMSMLDSSLLFFFVLAIASFLRSITDPEREGLHLTCAGVAIGVACTVKWSGALLPMAFFAYYAVSQRDYQHMHLDLRSIAALIVLPGVVFVALHLLLGFDPSQFIAFMAAKVKHHVAYSPIGVVPITSRPWEWLLLQKPVAFLPVELTQGDGPIVAAGHPIGHLALLAIAALPRVCRTARRRPAVKLGLLLAAVQLVAWAMAPRITFLYYLVTITPFVVVAVVDALSEQPSTKATRAVTTTLLVLQLAYTAYLVPVIGGYRVPERWQRAYAENPFLAHALRDGLRPSAEEASR